MSAGTTTNAGFQLLPLNGGDVDMLHGGSGDNGTQVTETSTNLAEPTKELTEFSIDTGIQEFVIKESEYNTGRAVKDPVNILLYDLTGKVTIIGKPTIRYLQERSPLWVKSSSSTLHTRDTPLSLFVTDRPVKELQEQGIRAMFVGNGSGRITRVGNEEIVFHKDLDRCATKTEIARIPPPVPTQHRSSLKKQQSQQLNTRPLPRPQFHRYLDFVNVLTMTFSFPETTLRSSRTPSNSSTQ
ncbi:hypothetical protein K457DRAFT_120750 [Linnemannia elongata AG-77]|uniref:Uncharacterized protein n=1 Tax=Linnemannia elongata AG-77 TaxID=1314771 RepID=A0A197KCW5_9FUNG|nr:hypothetical protein K457DRAFT_120750 [Linnemannia elongata AG-77]